ncbi:MAG: hypothetical protein ACREUT_20350 [Steroidobacteraceae bacterium]
MKIYLPHGSIRDRKVYVQPGKERRDNAEWFASDGKGGVDYEQPILFPVPFKGGMAEVPSHIGQYMLDKGLAQRSKLILPLSVTDATAEERVRPARRIYG